MLPEEPDGWGAWPDFGAPDSGAAALDLLLCPSEEGWPAPKHFCPTPGPGGGACLQLCRAPAHDAGSAPAGANTGIAPFQGTMKNEEMRVAYLSHGLQHLRRVVLPSPVRHVAHQPLARTLVALDAASTLHFLQEDGTYRGCRQAPAPATGLLYAAQVDRFVAWGEWALQVLDGGLRPLSRVQSAQPIRCGAYSERLNRVVTAGPGNLTLWDFRYGARSLQCRAAVCEGLSPQDVFSHLALDAGSAAPQRCFACCDSGAAAFDLSAGKLLSFQKELHSRAITDITYCEAIGSAVTASRDTTIKAWDEDWHVQTVFVGHTAPVVAVTAYPQRPLLFSASQDGTIRTWNLNTVDQVDQVHVAEPVEALETQSASLVISLSGPSLNFWKISKLYCLHTPLGSPAVRLRCVDLRALGDFPVRVLCVCRDGSVRLLEAESGRPCSTLALERPGQAHEVDYCLPLETLFVLTERGDLLRVNAAVDPMAVKKSTLAGAWDSRPGCLLLYSHTVDAAAAHSTWLRVAESKGLRKPWQKLPLPMQDKNRYLVILGHQSGFLSVVEWFSGRVQYTVAAHGPMPVTALAEYPTQTCVISAGADLTVKMWRLFPYAEECLLPLLCFSCSCPATHVCALGETLAVAFQDPETVTYSVVFYNLVRQTRMEHSPEDDAQDSITGLCHCPNLKLFASASRDGSVKIWDARNRLLRHLKLNSIPESLAFANPRGDLLVGIERHLYLIHHSKYLPSYYKMKLLCATFLEPLQDVPLPVSAACFERLVRENVRRLKEEPPLEGAESPLPAALQGDVHKPERTSTPPPSQGFAQLVKNNEDLQLLQKGRLGAAKKVRVSKKMKEEAFEKYLEIFYKKPHRPQIPREDTFDADEVLAALRQAGSVSELYGPHQHNVFLGCFGKPSALKSADQLLPEDSAAALPDSLSSSWLKARSAVLAVSRIRLALSPTRRGPGEQAEEPSPRESMAPPLPPWSPPVVAAPSSSAPAPAPDEAQKEPPTLRGVSRGLRLAARVPAQVRVGIPGQKPLQGSSALPLLSLDTPLQGAGKPGTGHGSRKPSPGTHGNTWVPRVVYHLAKGIRRGTFGAPSGRMPASKTPLEGLGLPAGAAPGVWAAPAEALGKRTPGGSPGEQAAGGLASHPKAELPGDASEMYVDVDLMEQDEGPPPASPSPLPPAPLAASPALGSAKSTKSVAFPKLPCVSGSQEADQPAGASLGPRSQVPSAIIKGFFPERQLLSKKWPKLQRPESREEALSGLSVVVEPLHSQEDLPKEERVMRVIGPQEGSDLRLRPTLAKPASARRRTRPGGAGLLGAESPARSFRLLDLPHWACRDPSASRPPSELGGISACAECWSHRAARKPLSRLCPRRSGLGAGRGASWLTQQTCLGVREPPSCAPALPQELAQSGRRVVAGGKSIRVALPVTSMGAGSLPEQARRRGQAAVPCLAQPLDAGALREPASPPGIGALWGPGSDVAPEEEEEEEDEVPVAGISTPSSKTSLPEVFLTQLDESQYPEPEPEPSLPWSLLDPECLQTLFPEGLPPELSLREVVGKLLAAMLTADAGTNVALLGFVVSVRDRLEEETRAAVHDTLIYLLNRREGPPAAQDKSERRFVLAALRALLRLKRDSKELMEELMAYYLKSPKPIRAAIKDLIQELGIQDPHDYFFKEMESWPMEGVESKEALRETCQRWLEGMMRELQEHRNSLLGLRALSGGKDSAESSPEEQLGDLTDAEEEAERTSPSEQFPEEPPGEGEGASADLQEPLERKDSLQRFWEARAEAPRWTRFVRARDAVCYFIDKQLARELAEQERLLPSGTKSLRDTVMALPPIQKRPAILRLGETNVMLRKRVPERFYFPYIFSRYVMKGFVPFVKLPLPRIHVGPFLPPLHRPASPRAFSATQQLVQRYFIPKFSYADSYP
ncbi:WD repeat-containing protein 97 [Varanus komodoensis]|uniref:WD repeat-containing protein 97 n=1 Tax=Varanus komodoensis TaxID=61221 RepID=UPI001CF7A5F1|nr:WD repeat-containing protein 97 [Varanus komodoensis]